LVGAWRNLRNTRDKNDFYLTLQYHQDNVRGSKGKKYGNINVIETTSDLDDGKTVEVVAVSKGSTRFKSRRC